MQFNHTQYADLADAKAKIPGLIDMWSEAILAFQITRQAQGLRGQWNDEKLRQAQVYLDELPATTEGFELVQAYSDALGITLVAAAEAIVADIVDWKKTLLPPIELERVKGLKDLEDLAGGAVIQDAVDQAWVTIVAML